MECILDWQPVINALAISLRVGAFVMFVAVACLLWRWVDGD